MSSKPGLPREVTTLHRRIPLEIPDGITPAEFFNSPCNLRYLAAWFFSAAGKRMTGIPIPIIGSSSGSLNYRPVYFTAALLNVSRAPAIFANALSRSVIACRFASQAGSL